MKKSLITLGLISTIGLTFIACNKEDNEIKDPTAEVSYQSTEDNNTAQKHFDYIQNAVENSYEANDEKARVGSLECYSSLISLDDNGSGSGTITITFDSTKCSDLKTRSGKIICSFTGPYRNEGSVLTTTTEDFYVNGIKVEGTKTVTNTGKNSDDKTAFKIVVKDAKLTFTDGKTATWSSEKTRVWEVGEDTKGWSSQSWLDDEYLIYGNSNGVNRDGNSYSVTIKESTPLHIDIDCWIATNLPKSGIITISPEGLEDRIVDYANGEEDAKCDAKFLITIGSFSFSVGI